MDRKLISMRFKGRNYQSLVNADYLDNEGLRRVILATKNDKEEVICELEIRPPVIDKE